MTLLLLHHSCVDCGESDPLVLDFDHVRGMKKRHVSRMISGGTSIETLRKEIEKCVVRCANCHRRKTARELAWFKSRRAARLEVLSAVGA
jgi:hypothetical protein